MITLPAMQLDVAEACSGIRSLLSLVTLAIIYGYLMETRKWVRVALVCAAIPIAVAANAFRIFGTGMLVWWGYEDKAEGFYHGLSGLLIFVVALILLFAVHRLISLFSMARKNGSPVAPGKVAPLREQPAGELGNGGTGSLRFGLVAVPLLAAAILFHGSGPGIIPVPPDLSSLPSQIDGWTGFDQAPLDKETLDILGHVITPERQSRCRLTFTLFIFLRKERATPSILQTTACREQGGFQLRGKSFGLPVRIARRSR